MIRSQNKIKQIKKFYLLFHNKKQKLYVLNFKTFIFLSKFLNKSDYFVYQIKNKFNIIFKFFSNIKLKNINLFLLKKKKIILNPTKLKLHLILLYLNILKKLYLNKNLKHNYYNILFIKCVIIYKFNFLKFKNFKFIKKNLKMLNFFETSIIKIFLLIVKKSTIKNLIFLKNLFRQNIKIKNFFISNFLIKKLKLLLLNFLIRTKFLRFLIIKFFELNLKSWLNLYQFKNKILFNFYQFFLKLKI